MTRLIATTLVMLCACGDTAVTTQDAARLADADTTDQRVASDNGAASDSGIASDNGAASGDSGVADALNGAIAADVFALLSFEESSGNTAIDISVPAYNGTLVGPTRVAGRFGSALSYDGVDDRVEMASIDTSAFSGLAISMYFNADTAAQNDNRLISQSFGTAEQDHDFMLSFIEGGGQTRLRFRLRLDDGSTRTLIASSGAVTPAQWTHAVATFDGQLMRLYVDGTKVGELAAAGTPLATAAPLTVGQNPDGYGTFAGKIDDLLIVKRGLSEAEIDYLRLYGAEAFYTQYPQIPVLPNQPPVVDAGQAQSVTLGNTLTTTSASASDPDGDPLSFAWAKVSGPGTVMFSNAASLATDADFSAVGSYVLSLTASDGNLSATDSVTIIVSQPGSVLKPGPGNTGPNNPSLLTPSGSITVTQAGTIIENIEVTGGIKVSAPNTVIRNFRIDCAGSTNYGIQVESSGSAVIEHGEIVNCVSAGLFGVNFEARHLNIHEQGGDGMKCRDNTLVEYSWIHHLGKNPGAHADGNQTRLGSNITFRYNNFDMPVPESPNGPGAPYKSNAASINQAHIGNISNMLFEGNWLNGGNYTIYLTTPTPGFTVSNVTLINNRFGRDYRYGVLNTGSALSNITITGNVWDDTGALMSINNP